MAEEKVLLQELVNELKKNNDLLAEIQEHLSSIESKLGILDEILLELAK